MTDPAPAVSFADIRRILADFPGPDAETEAEARRHQDRLTKPPGALGRLETLAAWLAAWQHRHPPRLDRPRIAVFAGNHGVAAARGVSAYPVAVTAEMVRNFQTGGAAVNQLCATVDAELRVYELDLDHPTADFTEGPAMTETACAHAMAYGMMAAEPGLDVLGIGEMGIGNTTAAAAICLALFGGDARDWVGPGTGVAGEALLRKIAAVEAGLAANPQARWEPLEALRCLGGFEIAAMAGAIIAARLARIPVLLDGYVSTAAAAVLYRLDSSALDHCVVAHRSAEPAHDLVTTAIAQRPLLDLGMRLGEGSGAALAVSILRAAVACHTGMATFGEAGVSGAV